MEYRFLVETTKIENTSFPFKTALSEADVKTNRIATTSDYFIILEFNFRVLFPCGDP